MRFSKIKSDDPTLIIDENETRTSPKSSHRDQRSFLQCHTLRRDDAPSPSSEYIYTEIVKAIGNNEFVEEKRLLKRASWSPAVLQEHGLPPTGKRLTNEPILPNKAANRIRIRPKAARYYQPQQAFERPVSFNEKYNHYQLIDQSQRRLSNSSLNRNGSFSHQRHEPSPSPSSSSVDTIVQITTRASPSLESSDFISDTSTASSVTTTNTVTSLSSNISSQIRSPSFERFYSSTKRPLLSDYQQQNSTPIDYKFLSPVSQTNTAVHSSSPISSSSSFTYPKGHEQSLSSPIGSPLNQYPGFTSQTLNADIYRNDDRALPTTTTNARRIMTMSMSPNRHHNQIHSAKAIITSTQISPTTNNSDGLKQQQQRDQTELTNIGGNGCLKSPTNLNHNNRIKKSVHFDWHLPREIRSTSPSLPVKTSYSSNYRPTMTIASLSYGHGNGDNDEQKKLFDDQRDVGRTLREKERIETTRGTISTNSLTNNTSTILRSFSLSPSPLSKEKNNDSRRQREEKKENVDEPNCTTTRRVTTAAAHLHCTTPTATVTFNDGSNNVSQKKESNSTNNSNTNLLKRQSSSVEKSMPLNNLLVKTSSLNTIINPQPSTKKLISNSFLSLIGRSNSSNNKSSISTEENKQLRRTSSTQLRAQRKAKQQTTLTTGTNGNKRLSTDVESLLPVPSINNNHCEISKEDIHIFDKVTPNHITDRQSSINKTINGTSSSNIDSSIPLCINTNINNNSSNSTTTIMKSDEGDSLNNGLLFRPVTDPKCDYVLHNHQTIKKEPFFLSPPKSLSNGDESTMMQTSTLIISTPPQYHYYLYPPINNTNTLSSSASSSSSTSSSSKKNPKIISTTNRTISNVSINSVSTNSSSSYPSYESQIHDQDYQQSSQTPLTAEDETLSSSTYSITNHKARQKKVVQSALIDWKMKSSSETNTDSTMKTKPVILSDSVQAFWPPPPSPSTLNEDSGLTTMTLTTEQTKQSESIPIPNHILSSTYNNDSMNVNHSDILTTQEEIGSYSEQHTFSTNCLRNASDTSLEDTQASYTERLREKSRSIPMNGTNDMYSYLTRSISKDALNDSHIRTNTNFKVTEFPFTNENISRPTSAGQQNRTAHILTQAQTLNSEIDFQSKREFFENRTFTDNTSLNTSLTSIQTNLLPTKPKLYTLSPSNSQINHNHPLQQTTINNNPQRNITRRSWNDLSSRQLPPPPPPSLSSDSYSESPTNQASLPPPPLPPTIRKPVRIVKAIQRSSPPMNESITTNRPLAPPKTYSLAKPGLFSASPLNSYQKLPNKSLNSIRRFQSRDENDLQSNLKEFALRYPHNHSLNELAHLTNSNEHHLSTDYTRALFPIPDRLRRIRSRQSSGGDTSSLTTSSNSSSDYIHRTVSNGSCIFDDDTLRQTEDLLINLRKRLDNLKENQRTINEETEDNKILGAKLVNLIESNAESNEIEKFKLHINEIDTITSILLKLSSRLAKVENDLLLLSDEHTKTSLIERREKAQQKHEEAKSLKDGIDRRSRLVTTILKKYFSNEQYDDYEHFIRMKSTLLMDAKDIEENIFIVEKQIKILNNLFLTNSSKIISSTA